MTISTITQDMPRPSRGDRTPTDKALRGNPANLVKHLANHRQPGTPTLRSMGFIMYDGSFRVGGASNYGSNMQGDNNFSTWMPQVTGIGVFEDGTFDEDYQCAQILKGYNHTFYLSKNGDLFGSGYNGHGQVGDNATTNRNYFRPIYPSIGPRASIPRKIVKVVGTTNGYPSTASTFYALCEDGTVWAWGYNGYGQVGVGNTTSSYYYPRHMRDNSGTYIDDAIDIEAAGAEYGAVHIVRRDGTVWGCGYNGYGQLGMGHESNRVWFYKCVLPDNERFIKVKSTGSQARGTTLFFTKSGKIYGCGHSSYLQTGTGSNANIYSTPAKVLYLGGDGEPKVVDFWIYGGRYGSGYATDSNGDFWMWGYNGYGQLGTNNTTQYNPLRAHDTWMGRHDSGPHGAPEIVRVGFAGYDAYGITCAVAKDGRGWTTGYNGHGQTGHGHAGNQRYWRKPFLPSGKKVMDAVGYGHSNQIVMCYLTDDGNAYTSGYNGFGAALQHITDSNHDGVTEFYNRYIPGKVIFP